MLLVKRTPMALGIPSPQLNQQSLYRHNTGLPSILHQFAGHFPHALLSLLVSKVPRHFRATRHALPSVHSVCRTATGTQIALYCIGSLSLCDSNPRTHRGRIRLKTQVLREIFPPIPVLPAPVLPQQVDPVLRPPDFQAPSTVS